MKQQVVWKEERERGISKMIGLLKFITCGSVDDGKSTLIGHILYDSKLFPRIMQMHWLMVSYQMSFNVMAAASIEDYEGGLFAPFFTLERFS